MSNNISKAMLNIGSLEADARNQHDNYDYISADKILERVGKVLGNLEITVIPAAKDVDIKVYNYTDSYGNDKTMYSAVISMEMTIIDGDFQLVVPWVGSGVDYRVPDKAVYKAITSGHKYFLTKLLMIGVGNEDSEHEPQTRPEPASKPEPKHGKDQTRPWHPDMLTNKINGYISKYADRELTEKQEKVFNATFFSLFDDDAQRHLFTNRVAGHTSSKDLSDAEVLALIKWMDYEKQVEGGKTLWVPSGAAKQEIIKVVNEIAIDQGQQNMDEVIGSAEPITNYE